MYMCVKTVLTFPRKVYTFKLLDLPSICKLYLAPRGQLFDTAIPEHQKRPAKIFEINEDKSVGKHKLIEPAKDKELAALLERAQRKKDKKRWID